MSLLNVSNLTFDSGSCVSATGCTLDGYQEDIESCLPQVVKNYKVLAIINIVMIIIVGGFGNLLTIVAICVARIRYHKILKCADLNRYAFSLLSIEGIPV